MKANDDDDDDGQDLATRARQLMGPETERLEATGDRNWFRNIGVFGR